MVPSTSEGAPPTPPEPPLSTLLGTTTNGVNANSEMFDFKLRPKPESKATSSTAGIRLNSVLCKLTMRSVHLFGVIGVLATISVLIGKTGLRWSLEKERSHYSSTDIRLGVSGNSSRLLEAHDGDGHETSVGARLSHEQPSGSAAFATSVALPPAMKSTALLVAVNNETLAIWSDFVSSARKATPGNLVSHKQELPCGKGSTELDCEGSKENNGNTKDERERPSVPVEEPGCGLHCFPPVWIVTSDSRVDKVVREDMPHLFSLFVPFDSDVGSDGTGAPNNHEDHTRWADMLDRFLEENPEVAVLGAYGEGALPTAVLLPDYVDSYFAASDVDGNGSGIDGDRSGISSVLWPVLSEAERPTAVISRSRMWWDRGDGRTSNGLGEWMSDKFVAQVWCNRAVLVATGKDSINPAEASNNEPTTFLDSIQRLVRDPSATEVVVVDGTKVIPSRFLHPPTTAVGEVFGEDSRGSSSSVQNNRFVFLRRLVKDAREKTERERQRRGKQLQPSAPPDGAKTSGSTAFPGPTPQKLKTLPEINYYIGTLDLTLGFDLEAITAGPDTARAVSDHGDSPTVSGATKSGHRSGGEGKGYGTGSGASASVATIMRSRWPPEHILDTVVQPLVPEEDRERATSPMPALFDNASWGASQKERKQQGIVIVSSVNCGYLDMASNFLQSVKQAAGDLKVLFVARDEEAFDFLDALSPGCTVLFPELESETTHSVQAGRWGDNIFKQQTIARPDILLQILRQGYKAFYTDVDTVWLGNALSLLPNSQKTQNPPVSRQMYFVTQCVHVPRQVEVMLQADSGRMKCTCFMYLDSTPNAVRLLELWKQEIAETSVFQDQAAFQSPLAQMLKAGLVLSMLPEEVMLPGNRAFDEMYVKSNYALLQKKLLIVHNNWIVGHDPKRQRFQRAGLWEVDDWEFPTCQRRNLRSLGEFS
ncbi:unnamed protein product [Ectocarpus sp. 12 AP-2014]